MKRTDAADSVPQQDQESASKRPRIDEVPPSPSSAPPQLYHYPSGVLSPVHASGVPSPAGVITPDLSAPPPAHPATYLLPRFYTLPGFDTPFFKLVISVGAFHDYSAIMPFLSILNERYKRSDSTELPPYSFELFVKSTETVHEAACTVASKLGLEPECLVFTTRMRFDASPSAPVAAVVVPPHVTVAELVTRCPDAHLTVQPTELFHAFLHRDQAALQKRFTVTVKAPSGKLVQFKGIHPACKVETIMQLISESEGYAPGQQRLLFYGKQLNGARTLAQSGIKQDATIFLALRMPGYM